MDRSLYFGNKCEGGGGCSNSNKNTVVMTSMRPTFYGGGSNFLESRFCKFFTEKITTTELLRNIRILLDPSSTLLNFLMGDSMVKFRENQPTLNRQQADEVLEEYSKFIFLKIQENDFDATKLSPSLVIDEVWHYHMSMPKHYRDFNKKIFGLIDNFIDHNPEGAKNYAERERRFQNTIEAYRRYFSEDPKGFIWDMRLPLELTPEDIERRKVPDRRNIMIKIRTLNRKDLDVFVDLHEFGDYVEDLKTLIEAREKIPINQQRMIFNGKQLEDCRKLCSYEKMSEGSMLHLVIRLSGC
jgi:hypothetical protein